MKRYAKAIGGAITALLVYVAGRYGLELPTDVVAALQVLITGAVVWRLRNAEKAPAPAVLEGGGSHLSAPPARPRKRRA